jgi:hypothetical protein
MDAIPAFLLASAYAVTGLGRHAILGFDGKKLAALLLVEFFAVFFGIFILAMIIGWKKNRDREARLRIGTTLGFTAAVAVGLSFAAGPWGPLLFVMATLGTYWSPWKRWYRDEVISVSVMRAFIYLVLYAFWVLLAYHPPEWSQLWHDVKATHLAGMFYFMCVGVLEWSGDMDG